ncbi:NAD(P)H-binding protein [Allostreptomyces psammosilenae]|uniref:NAD(P)H dehydrogenase (Quinone) n=1 Tax=Allostreptomyces psammosilenae TaxID=1892865 RepID=A0A853A407_9ACTN|nr:NAD(P)H-binding protein [Allostreptomyces psammosilenae]NYI05232.1 NAD(P)H dehydrogenase (quinone) [Allostreptomyces psammosilenae]
MILVTGASGALARLVTARLATATTPTTAPGGRPALVVGSHDPDRVAGTVPEGVEVRLLDLDAPATLAPAFRGVDVVLLVSAGYAEDDVVTARHGAAIEAAESAGVRHLVYTSLTAAGDHLRYALAHRWTERRLAASSLGWTVLRNGLYAELLAPEVAAAAASGTLTAPLGQGRLAAVAREDLADVAARVLAETDADLAGGPGAASRHAGRAYELVGTEALGPADLVAAAERVRGGAVDYRPGDYAGVRAGLVGLGVPLWQPDMLVSTYSAVAGGFLGGTRTDLPGLLDGAPRPAVDVLTEAAAALVSGANAIEANAAGANAADAPAGSVEPTGAA